MFGVVAACVISAAPAADGGRLRALVDGVALSSARVLSIAVDSDAGEVDTATIVLEPGRAKAPGAGAAVSVEGVGSSASGVVFKGEIVGLEPVTAESKVTIRAFNRLHRLTRGRKSRTFENQSDADIAAAIATEAGLQFGQTGPEALVGHAQVFQHNQTDLEFLRERAARIGYDVFVDDSTLFFSRPPDLPMIALGCDPTRGLSRVNLTLFHPRLSSANQVSSVVVRGFDPERREVEATATRRLIPLSPGGMKMNGPPGTLLDLGFVEALGGTDAAYGAANGTLAAVTRLDVSGEVAADGSAGLAIGARVSIDGVEQHFNGEYFVTKVTHRYNRGSSDSWHTLLRVTRADRGVYVLPEIGDEVLVAFENGDLARPFIVGSLWDDEAPAEQRTERPCP